MLLFAFLLGCNDHIINEIKQPEIIVAPATAFLIAVSQNDKLDAERSAKRR